MAFNESKQDEYLSFSAVKQKTGLADAELSRILQSLIFGKHRILLKKTKGRDIREMDEFTVNASFSAPLHKIRIPVILPKQVIVTEDKETRERVFQDRQYQVDAAIVRVMKTHGTIEFRKLTTEVFEQLRFPIESSDLKKRIESLMEREYIKRDDEQSDKYQYIA